MLDLLKARWKHGYQAVKNIRKARIHEKFRGFPLLSATAPDKAAELAKICPTKALTAQPFSLDLGKCNFCNACARESRNKSVSFCNSHYTSADSREKLIITPGRKPDEYRKTAITCRKEIKRVFGRSLKLRSVCAGGCNACEMELNACSNVNFDMGRFGIDMVASPRHADGIIITGPVTANMSYALANTLDAVPDPKIVIALGTCAISGGLFAGTEAVDRQLIDKLKIDLFIPGCPSHPLCIINGILDFLGRK
jgi:Ni,Fe-hydrogenase III small subunit